MLTETVVHYCIRPKCYSGTELSTPQDRGRQTDLRCGSGIECSTGTLWLRLVPR